MVIENESKFAVLRKIGREDLPSSEKPVDVASPAVKPAVKKCVIPPRCLQAEKSVQFAEKEIIEEQKPQVEAFDEKIAITSRIDTSALEGSEASGEGNASPGKPDDVENVDGDANTESEDDELEKPEVPRPKLTLGEWKAQQKSKTDEPHFNVRLAGEDCTKRIQQKMEKLVPIQKEEAEVPSSGVKKHSNKDKKAGKEGKRKHNQKSIPSDFLFQTVKKVPVREHRETDVVDNRRVVQNRARNDDCGAPVKLLPDDWRKNEQGSVSKKQHDTSSWRNPGQKQQDFAAGEKNPENANV